MRNGLMSVPDGNDALVAVHDAARPLVSVEMISRGWLAAEESGAAVPAVSMTDSIRRIEAGVSVSVPRKDYVKVQTPQVFDASLLKHAYEGTLSDLMTDDASVVEAAGHKISLYEGSPYNMKVTEPLDIKIAETLIELIS